jgi:CheY-like chemotaxis protein
MTDEPLRAPEPWAGSEERPLRGIDILLVDDDRDSRTIYGTILKYYGAHVVTAQSKPAALKVLTAFIPDIIVSDIAMPGGDGLSLMRDVRDLSTRAAFVPAIAITAFDEENPQVRTFNAGFQRQLRKPVTPTHLCQTILELVSRSARRARPGAESAGR